MAKEAPMLGGQKRDTMTVYYLPKKLEQGPLNGTKPRRAAAPVKRVALFAKNLALEEVFRAANYQPPRGDADLNYANNAVWNEALLPLLEDWPTVKAITGGAAKCSRYCLSEQGDEHSKACKFVDTARFKLHSCSHHSRHLQCIVTNLLLGYSYTLCPIQDTPQCRGEEDANGKYGQAHFWAPQDYENFTKAFFRNEKLCQAFLKPQFR